MRPLFVICQRPDVVVFNERADLVVIDVNVQASAGLTLPPKNVLLS
jgi:hypothetical protein